MVPWSPIHALPQAILHGHRAMNLPLHYGVLGALEAGLIALLIGVLCFWVWNAVCHRANAAMGHAIGWACVSAVILGAGVVKRACTFISPRKFRSEAGLQGGAVRNRTHSLRNGAHP